MALSRLIAKSAKPCAPTLASRDRLSVDRAELAIRQSPSRHRAQERSRCDRRGEPMAVGEIEECPTPRSNVHQTCESLALTPRLPRKMLRCASGQLSRQPPTRSRSPFRGVVFEDVEAGCTTRSVIPPRWVGDVLHTVLGAVVVRLSVAPVGVVERLASHPLPPACRLLASFGLESAEPGTTTQHC